MSGAPQDIVAKADALLANVTPGAWTWKRYDDDYDHVYVETAVTVSGRRHVLYPFADEPCAGERLIIPNPADAAFIAAAPDLVRGLLAEVARLRALVGESEGGNE